MKSGAVHRLLFDVHNVMVVSLNPLLWISSVFSDITGIQQRHLLIQQLNINTYNSFQF